ncbi:DsbC family protein [Thiosocius teredinicola]|uniref:DsbC family protein n=1 Tax=Thiosocius teredinicola TaxID=1973002 RepID=UPI000990C0F5
MIKRVTAVVIAVFFSAVAQAAVDAATQEKIRNSLKVLLPGLVPDEIRETPLDNIYELTFGARLAYITGDGRYLMQGKIIDIEQRVEITEKRLTELKKAALSNISEDQMIIYGPEDAKHTVTVFTDIDCGFCRRLHSEMASYNDAGIRIRYLFYPRAGIGSDSYNKAVSVWCADDRKAAMNAAKAGQEIEAKTCDNPVSTHHALGQSMRIQGTPALMLESGELVPGYVPADKLRRALDESGTQAGS